MQTIKNNSSLQEDETVLQRVDSPKFPTVAKAVRMGHARFSLFLQIAKRSIVKNFVERRILDVFD